MPTRHIQHTRRFIALGLSVVALAACGTRVQTDAAGAPVQPDGAVVAPAAGEVEAGLDAGTVVVPGGTVAQPAGTTGFGGGTSTAPRGASGGTSGGSGGSASGGGSASAGTGGSTAVGPGITATKIYIGAPWNSDANAGNAALGVSQADSGDERDYWAAVLDDLNKRGGILGRKVEVIFAEFKAATNEPVEAQQQAACDTWTKDNKVFAVYGGGGEVMLECSRKAGVLVTGGGVSTGPVYQQNPQLVDVSAIRFERLGQVSVDGLGALGYFKPEPQWPTGKVGLISWDTPDYRYAYEHGYVPALKKRGVTLADTAWVAEPATVNALGDASAAISSAVLRFQSAGIDHVFIQDGAAGVFRGGGLTILFLRTAESQQYRPRYGFNANNFPGDPNLPAEQQHGMLAIDYADFNPINDEGIAPNPHRERCFKIVTAKGLSVADPQKMANAAAFCEFTWFIETTLKRASALTLAGAISSAESLGTSFGSPTTYGTRLGPGRHDGVELVRAARFDDACACMKYATKPYAP